MPDAGQPRLEWIPLEPDWDPAEVAEKVYETCEKVWEEGWIFEKAEADALMESVLLHFRWPHPS